MAGQARTLADLTTMRGRTSAVLLLQQTRLPKQTIRTHVTARTWEESILWNSMLRQNLRERTNAGTIILGCSSLLHGAHATR